MWFKLVLLVGFLILFQPLEAKKKKQTSSPATSISTYVKSVSDFFQDAWEALLDLLPKMPATTPSKLTKKKSKNKRTGLEYYVKSARKNFNYFYKSMSDSMDMFRLGRSRGSQKDANVEGVFYVELLAAEMLDNFTWGLAKFASTFDRRT